MEDMIPFRLSECEVSHGSIGRGQMVIVVHDPNSDGPFGTVWGFMVEGGKYFVVADSYVHPRARRLGIRSLINDYIFTRWNVDAIRTTGCTEDGKAFMRSHGYRYCPGAGWQLDRDTWKRRT